MTDRRDAQIAISAARQRALEEAARACEQTCGKWQMRKTKEGEKELFCPCAEAVRQLKAPA